jgi:hypothetical protein
MQEVCQNPLKLFSFYGKNTFTFIVAYLIIGSVVNPLTDKGILI